MEKESSIVLHINSKDRTDNLDINNQYSTSHFKYFFKQPIINNIGNSFLLSLHSSIIPYSFYNIRTNINDIVTVTVYDPATGGQINVKVLTITPGSYTVGSLITELETQFLTLVADGILTQGITIGFNRQTQKLTFITKAVADNNKIDLDFALTEKGANIPMGFRDREQTVKFTNVISTSAVSSNVCDVNGSVHSVFIRTSLTSTGQLDSSSGGFTTILGRIPIEKNFGSVLFFNPTNATHSIKVYDNYIQSISIKLTDDNGRLLDLNGLNFTLSLEFEKLFTPKEEIIPRSFIPNTPNMELENTKTKKKKSTNKKK